MNHLKVSELFYSIQGVQMNERIEELYKQSFIEVQDENSFPCMTFSKQKFAELIVQECMRMCDVAAVGYETHGHIKEANGCYSAKEYIEEHFGFE